MITRPTCAELIAAVRAELRDAVLPTISDAAAIGVLACVDEVLRCVAVRSDHEVAWMSEEIEEIERLAEHFTMQSESPTSLVAEALAELRAARSGSLHVGDLAQEYSRAGEVLSRCIEWVIVEDSGPSKYVDDVLEHRLATEALIRGAEFALVARG
jgi:hypothetical protein